jgi:hypothetical protein
MKHLAARGSLLDPSQAKSSPDVYRLFSIRKGLLLKAETVAARLFLSPVSISDLK